MSVSVTNAVLSSRVFDGSPRVSFANPQAVSPHAAMPAPLKWVGALGLSFGGGTTGITYDSSTEASAMRVGGWVIGGGLIALTSKGSSTGSVKITGLPWAARNDNDSNGAFALYLVNVTFSGRLQGFADLGATTATVGQVTEAGTASNLADTNFANSSQVRVTFMYRAA